MNSHLPSRGDSTITIDEEKTPFQQRLDSTVRHLHSVWRVNVVIVVVAALLAVAQLLFAGNLDTDGSLPVVYVPRNWLGISLGRPYWFHLLRFMPFSSTCSRASRLLFLSVV